MDAVIKKLMPQAAYMDKPVTDRPSEAEVGGRRARRCCAGPATIRTAKV